MLDRQEQYNGTTLSRQAVYKNYFCNEVLVSEKTRQIAFYGTEEYRFRLQREALDRGIKVQVLLEEAVERYLHTESRETVTAKRHSPEIERLITWWNHPPNKRERALRDWLREIIKTE